MKQSFTWWAFTWNQDIEPADLLKAAADIGYAGVEMVPEELWQPARDLGLELALLSGHDDLEVGFNDPANHDELRATVEASIAKGAEVGANAILVFSGIRNGIDDDRGAEACAQGLSKLVDAAAAAKIPLVLELLNSKIDHPGYQCDSTAWGRRVVEAVGSPWLRLLYDVYHMQIMEGDVIRTLKDNLDLIGHVHTAGVPGRRDIDDTQELNYRAICWRLARYGYHGYVGHEFLPRGDAVEALRAAHALCTRAAEAGAAQARS